MTPDRDADARADREALLQLLLAEEGIELDRPTIPPLEAGEASVLSFAQERMWFLDQFETDTAALNVRAAVRLRGALDVGALTRSFDAILARHAVLRTTIVAEMGDPEPVVAPPSPMPIRHDDVRGAESLIAPMLAEEAARTFDLQRELPVAVRLIRIADDDHVLSVVMHHAASDGWSLKVFFEEMAALYGAFREGRPSPLPDLAIQYHDYAAWQRGGNGETFDRQLEYWRHQLAGPLPTFEIPPDFVRPARHTFSGAQIQHTVPSDVVGALGELGTSVNGTLFMVLLAAFEVVASRRAGEPDVVIGTPVAGRVRPEFEPLIGAFLNTLVLRTDLTGDPTFRELLGRVRDVTVQAFDHQDVPFELLLAELQPARDLSRTPLFQLFFNMMSFDTDTRPGVLPGLELDVLAQQDLGSKFDLTLYATRRGGEVDLLLVYNSTLFEPATMRLFLDQYLLLLRSVAADPERPINDYTLVTPETAAALPDPSEPLDHTWHGSVPCAIRRHAAATPDATAVVDPSIAWTYRALAGQMDALAGWLSARGVGSGQVVAIYGHRSASLVLAVASVLASGAAYLLLDPTYPPSRLVKYLRISRPTAWVALDAAGPPPPEIEAALDELGVTVRRSIGPRAELAHAPPDGVEPLERDAVRAITEQLGPDSPACVTFTSGSTGEPKAVLGRHGSLTHFLPWQTERFAVTPADRFSMLSGLAHDPIQRDMFWPLWAGATIVVPDPDQIGSPGWLAQWLLSEGVTVAHLTPAMGQLVTDSTSVTGRVSQVDNLRLALFIGDVLTRSDVKRFRALAPEATIVNLYGTTETQRASGHHVVDPDDEPAAGGRPRREALPLGAGIPGTQLLVRTEAGAPAAVGEIGEVVLRSHHLALGYLGRPDETAARFVEPAAGGQDGARLYRTGDIGRYRSNGEVEFFGRRDRQIQLRGFRIELGEVRAALVAHDDVSDAVVDVRGDNGTRRLVAYVVPEPGSTPRVDDLRRFLRAQLPAHMVPADFVPLTRVPLTPNGKLDRASLPAPDDSVSTGDRGEPRDALEAQLVKRWQEVLGRPRVGIHDNFFDLGGYSLLATRLFGLIERDTGKRIPVSALFEAPTVAELADVVREGDVPAEWESLVAIQPNGSQRPFFYVTPYMISVLQLAHLGTELGQDQPLYGLQPQGLDGRRPIHSRIEDMAEAYIREIKTVQPRGPYRIGGHCSGSWVAFEMARQLEGAGEELDTVVLVDQGPPGVEQNIKLPSYLLSRIRFYFRDGRLRHAAAWQLKIALNRLRIRRRWNPSLEYAERVRAAHRAASREYEGGPIKTDLVLVRSDESRELGDKSWHTQWSEVTSGTFHEARAIGTHANLLEEPYVAVLAERIRWAFARSRRGNEPATAPARHTS